MKIKMADTSPCKRLALILIIFLLCLISSQTRGARYIPASGSKGSECKNDGVGFSCKNTEDDDNNNNSKNDNNNAVTPNINDGIDMMDYSPVRQNTPIHHN